MKAIPRGKFIAIQAYLKKIETFQINSLTLQLQELEEQQQTKPRVRRRKEIIKIRAKLNDIQTTRTIQSIDKSRSWFFEKVNKIDKPLTRSTSLIRKRRERIQINTFRNENREITIDTKEIQRIFRNLRTWAKWTNF